MIKLYRLTKVVVNGYLCRNIGGLLAVSYNWGQREGKGKRCMKKFTEASVEEIQSGKYPWCDCEATCIKCDLGMHELCGSPKCHMPHWASTENYDER
jgi:hypothetical protein